MARLDLNESLLAAGTAIGAYQIDSVIGRGGMGVVYLAHHATLGNRVALKVVQSSITDVSGVAQRFKLEAQVTASIRNSHIVKVFDLLQGPRGENVLVMEYVQGTSLAKVLAAEGLLQPVRALGIAAQIAEGLDACHAVGVIHRDLKPDNVLLTTAMLQPDYVKVIDFGIAKQMSSEQPRATSVAGMVVGTPHYLSPEYCDGRAVGPRADVYALGVVLYQMLTGRFPFDGDSAAALMYQHLNEEPRPPSALAPWVSPAIDAIALRCLAKAPVYRPSMTQLKVDLEKAREAAHRGAPPLMAREDDIVEETPLAMMPAAVEGMRPLPLFDVDDESAQTVAVERKPLRDQDTAILPHHGRLARGEAKAIARGEAKAVAPLAKPAVGEALTLVAPLAPEQLAWAEAKTVVAPAQPPTVMALGAVRIAQAPTIMAHVPAQAPAAAVLAAAAPSTARQWRLSRFRWPSNFHLTIAAATVCLFLVVVMVVQKAPIRSAPAASARPAAAAPAAPDQAMRSAEAPVPPPPVEAPPQVVVVPPPPSPVVEQAPPPSPMVASPSPSPRRARGRTNATPSKPSPPSELIGNRPLRPDF